MPVKITSFEAENVKRVKAIALEPTANGLTVIGGRNGQGKTSVLDAIAWTLGGNRRKPTDAKREGSATDPQLKVTLSNGIVVERKGKTGSLKVIDPEGRKSGQALLDGLISELAIDLPKFMAMSDLDKARELLGIIGVGDKLVELEQREQTLYNQRTTIGQLRDQKRGAADDMPTYPNAPAEPVSALELIEQQQATLAKNGENQNKRQRVSELMSNLEAAKRNAEMREQAVKDLQSKLDEALGAASGALMTVDAVERDLETAKKTAEQLHDESTAAIETSLADIEAINAKVRSNIQHSSALAEAEDLAAQYKDMTESIDAVRASKLKLLQDADLPLPGLAVDGGALTYNGRRWDCMSGSEQLIVAAAIVRKLKPDCGFVLLDKLEQMDIDTMREFGQWAEAEGLQVIATRVSTGDECSILIEDGYSKPGGAPATTNPVFEAAMADTAASEPKFNFPILQLGA